MHSPVFHMESSMKKQRIVLVILALLITLSVSACGVQPENDVDTNGVGQDENEVLLTIEGAEKTTLSRAEFLAIEQQTYHITRTNSKGETTQGDYTGVTWDSLAAAIGAPTDTKSVTLVASDGYSQAYTMDVLEAEQSLFAIEKDGAPITLEADNGQVWFCADESFTANYWTKFITKVIID